MNCVENEVHVIIECPIYDSVRKPLLDYAQSTCQLFVTMSNSEKFNYVFAHQETLMIRFLARTCCNILKCRNNILYNKTNT